MKLRNNILILGIIFTILISSIGCVKQQQKDSLEYETKVHNITYTYANCGSLKLKDIGLQLEDPNLPVSSNVNQKIISRNLTILHYKLKEAETIIRCYEHQQQSIINEYIK